MAKKIKTKTLNLYIRHGAFTSLIKRFMGEKDDYDFSSIRNLKKLLSNEKARMLNVIKTENPESIYHLARILKRDFKAVRQDIRLLEKFGFITLRQGKKGKRQKLKPEIAIDSLNININFQ